MWIQLLTLVASTLLSAALAPKQRPRAAALDDFDVPTAEEDRPIPVVFGRVEITGANVLWYGDLSTTRIRKGNILGRQTIGYRYFLGLHMALCYGPVNAVQRIRIEEREAWSGSVTANGALTINAPTLFGGKDREGGVQATVDVELGGAAQAVNAYLSTRLGGPAPAHRGVLGLVVRNAAGNGGAYIGNSPYVKPWGVTVERTSAGWFGGTAWYPARVAVGDGGMNPAHVIYQALTDPEWGMGQPAASLDDAGFRAAADALFAEGFGIRLLWNQQSSIEEFIGEVLNHVGASLGVDPQTGLISLRLIRGDYTPATLPLFNESNIERIDSFERQGWGETVNELTVTYTDPDSLKATGVTVHDLANIRAQGIVSETVAFPGIYDKALATRVAMRELQARSTPLARIRFRVNRSAWAVVKAGVVRISWARRGLVERPFRVLTVSRGTLESGALTIEAVEDIYAVAPGTYSDVPAAPGDVPAVVLPLPDDELGASVVSASLTAPPATPADTDSYIVPSGATGAWSGRGGQIATWDADRNAWVFSTPAPGAVIFNQATGSHVTVAAGGSVGLAPWAGAGASTSAAAVSYDDAATALNATNVQTAIEAIVLGGDRSKVTVRNFQNGLFFGLTFGGEYYDAPDATNWTRRAPAEPNETPLDGLFWDATTSRYLSLRQSFVYRSQTSDLYGQWDGQSITSFPLRGAGAGVTWRRIRRLNGTLYLWGGVPLGDGRYVLTNSTGAVGSWVEVGVPVGLPGLFEIVDIRHDGTRFLVFGHLYELGALNSQNFRPRVYTSTDLVNFSLVAGLAPTPATDSARFLEVAVGGTVWLALTQEIAGAVNLWRSTNSGSNWTRVTGVTWPANNRATSIVWDGTRFVMMGRGWSGRSTDGLAWTFSNPSAAVSGLDPDANYLAYTNGSGRVAAAASKSSGFVGTFTSTDALVWQETGELLVAAAEVSYQDSTTPPLGATTVQGAIVALANRPAGGGGGRSVRAASWAGAPIVTPTNDVQVYAPQAGTITRVVVLTQGGPGSCSIDVWRDSLSNYPPTAADSITGGSPITISSATLANLTSFPGWNTSINAGDVLTFRLNSSTNFTYIGIFIEVQP